jgi:3-isopropylmalate dehydrogenase
LGAERFLPTGEVLPESVIEELSGHDAILLGAVGDPAVPPGVLERGLLLKLRFSSTSTSTCAPPAVAGHDGPLANVKAGEIDFVVVREGTEGLYTGAGGTMHQGTAVRWRLRRVSTRDTELSA